MNRIDTWQIVHRERAALIEDLGGVAGNDWSTPSLCAEWTIHDVLAHLVNDAKTTKSSFFLALARAGFNFDRANQRGVERERRASGIETLAAFRAVSDRTTSAPAPHASRLVETIVHGEDIRRPLDLNRRYPIEAIVAAINYQLATSGSMGGSKERAAGVRLIATDAEFVHGDGPEARGSALDLMLALTGRDVGFDGLIGEGAEQLMRR